jgi:2-keto-4-pentenoate hydratase
MPPAGFKIGATGARMREYLSIASPVAGFMQSENIHRSGATLAFSGIRGVGVECEIAVRLARDLPAGPCSPAQAREAVGSIMAAIEVVENRYGPPPIGDLQAVGVPTLMADQMFHAAAILGDRRDPALIDFERLDGEISVDGSRIDGGPASELLGHPMAALAWLAGSDEAAAFGGLLAGQVVMLGSVTPTIWLSQPGMVTVRFSGLSEVVLTLS